MGWSEEDLDKLRRGERWDVKVSDPARERSPKKAPPDKKQAAEEVSKLTTLLSEAAINFPEDIDERLTSSGTLAAGIDPGQTTGVVLFDRDAGRIVAVMNASFWETVYLFALARRVSVHIEAHIEDPTQNKFTYGRHGASGPQRDRINRNVGRNQSYAELLIEATKLLGHHTQTYRPSKGKWKAPECEAITGYPPATENPFYNNQHVRDAIRVLYDHGVILGGDLSYLSEE